MKKTADRTGEHLNGGREEKEKSRREREATKQMKVERKKEDDGLEVREIEIWTC